MESSRTVCHLLTNERSLPRLTRPVDIRTQKRSYLTDVMTNKLKHVHLYPNASDWVSRALLLTAALALQPWTAVGIALRIPNQDPEAIARGNAFAATADNPSAIYYNPAGITQLPGANVQIGVLNYLGINTHYDSGAGTQSDTDFEVVPIPEIYATYSLKDLPLSFGLGVYAPFGLGVKWPEDSGFRTLAIESRLQYVTLNPVVAWKILPSLSLAAGPTLNYSKLEIKRGLATPTDVFKFDGNDIAYGFNAGLLWQPHLQWSFGVNYRSATTMNYEGSSSYDPGIPIPTANTTARVQFPQIISGGVSFRPTPKWNIEVNVDWTDWNTLDTVTLSGTKNLGFPFDLPLQLNWHASWLYEIGVTRYFENGWFISAGYFYSTDTTSGKYYTPAIPDTNLHVGSVGFGFKGEHWHWALAGQIITGPSREISDSQPNPFTGQTANGSYQLFVPTLSVSMGYHF